MSEQPTTQLADLGSLALFDTTDYAIRLSQREQYGTPPMSIINAAAPEWQARKKEWLGAYPELADGATEESVWGPSYHGKYDNWLLNQMEAMGTASTFDPCMAEICYSWYTRPGSLVYDPFAGGPIRGAVADILGRSYLGVDVRLEQVEANWKAHGDGGAAWLHADAAEYQPEPGSVDFVFSCPPYGGIERYSEQPDDLSTLLWPAFVERYRAAVANSVRALHDDRFAAFVVANFKEDEAGSRHRVMRDFCGTTIKAFADAGAIFYSEIVHQLPVGTTAVRSGFHFPKTRRVTPRHQMVLIFLKGDSRRAVEYVTHDAQVL